MTNVPVWVVKLAKFTCVGVSGACVDFGVTWLLKEKAKWNRYVANSTGFCLAVANNFFLNRAWTFEGDTHPVGYTFERFALVSTAGLAINNAVLFVLHKKLLMNFYVAKGLTTILVVAWNFTANYLFTFR